MAPQLGWVRGGGGLGGPPPHPLSGLCGRGGGALGGGLWSPGDASCHPRGGGGGSAVLAPGASHRPGGRALPPHPSTENGSNGGEDKANEKASKTGANCQDEKVLEVRQERNTYTWGGCSQCFRDRLG